VKPLHPVYVAVTFGLIVLATILLLAVWFNPPGM
jgi:uncharacterized membrane protein